MEVDLEQWEKKIPRKTKHGIHRLTLQTHLDSTENDNVIAIAYSLLPLYLVLPANRFRDHLDPTPETRAA